MFQVSSLFHNNWLLHKRSNQAEAAARAKKKQHRQSCPPRTAQVWLSHPLPHLLLFLNILFKFYKFLFHICSFFFTFRTPGAGWRRQQRRNLRSKGQNLQTQGRNLLLRSSIYIQFHVFYRNFHSLVDEFNLLGYFQQQRLEHTRLLRSLKASSSQFSLNASSSQFSTISFFKHQNCIVLQFCWRICFHHPSRK